MPLLLAVLLLGTQSGYSETAVEPVSPCAPDASLTVGLYGGIRADVNWSAASLECSGMPRPNGEGARLRFSGLIGLDSEARRIAIIIGLPNLKRGEAVHETPANVTIFEEDTGRFYSSSAASFCLTDINEHAQNASGGQDNYLISGVLYCVAPLAELKGSGGVTLTDLNFFGQLDWKERE